MHIHEFQQMMQELYSHRDLKRGVSGTYEWLVDEVEELGEALRRGDRQEMEGEFADVIAWLASLANITCVDLEMAALKKYRNKCPKCDHAPCVCTF